MFFQWFFTKKPHKYWSECCCLNEGKSLNLSKSLLASGMKHLLFMVDHGHNVSLSAYHRTGNFFRNVFIQNVPRSISLRPLRFWYLNRDVILPSCTFFIYHYVFAPYSHTISLLPLNIIFFSIHIFHIQLFINLLSLSDIIISLPVSPPPILSVLHLSFFLSFVSFFFDIDNLFFLILQSHHCILCSLLLNL